MEPMPINIYPADWYYNMCVHGFLKVLELGLGEKVVRSFLKNDGTVEIPGDYVKEIYGDSKVPFPDGVKCQCEIPEEAEKRIKKRVIYWWYKKSLEYVKEELPQNFDEKLKKLANKLFSFTSPYPNLLQRVWDDEFFDCLFTTTQPEGNVRCSMCGSLFNLEDGAIYYQAFFSYTFSSLLGSSLTKVPNFYWDNIPSIPMCHRCRSYLICYHIAEPRGFFVDTGSFKVNWEINELLAGEKVYGSIYSFLPYIASISSKIGRILGGWVLSRINVVTVYWEKTTSNENEKKLRCDAINPQVAKLLVDYSTSRYLGRLNKPDYREIWFHILNRDWEYLLNLAYTQLRDRLIGKNTKDDNTKIILYSKSILLILNLYTSIHNLEERGESMGAGALIPTNLFEEGRNGPFDINQNTYKNQVFRLLELTRLGRRDEIYHLLLRTYVAAEREFPKSLIYMLSKKGSEFKAGMYSYIAGITSMLEKEGEED